MKRLIVALLVATFTTLAAPRLPGLRSSRPPAAVVAQVGQAPDLLRLLRDASQPDEPLPPLERPKSLARGERWVPLLRFANVSVTDESVAKISALLDQASRSGVDAVVLEMATLGGSVPAGQEFARAIERVPVPVHCVADGQVMSMGFYVLQACDYRYMTRRSTLMVHEPHFGGEVPGHQLDLKNNADYLRKTGDAMAQHEGRRLRVGVDGLKARIEHGQDWFMDADEALSQGAVDEVVGTVERLQRRVQKAK